MLNPVPFHHVRIDGGPWKETIERTRTITARVCLEQCERTHRIDNFRRASGRQAGGFEGIYYNDSDVYKVLEGVAYLLQSCPDEALERAADAIINDICAAQQPDGYLYTFFILNAASGRWTDMSYHEAYCLGHMVEGAVAYHQATGKDKWLQTAIRAVRQMMSVIGPGKKHWVTGHQELELALVRLFRHTGDRDFLDYSVWLVNERGHGHLDTPLFADKSFFTPEYCQDDVPARSLGKVTGHAVRAMYYYSAIADIAALTGDEELHAALDRLWSNVVPANLYVTGGIGQSAANEGFTRDWSLPNLTAYCETCASVGMAMWNHRMNLLTGDAKYQDLVETELYNGISSGISLSGDRFFYENPLASAGQHHRKPWFGTSCCPTNLIRFLPSVGGYAYAVSDGGVYVNQYIPGSAEVDVNGSAVRLRVDTEYPWEGGVKISVDECPTDMRLMLRVPGWCEDFSVSLNGTPDHATPVKGYISLNVAPGDTVELALSMPVRVVMPSPLVREDEGRVAVARGPVVYCAEECDNHGIPTEYFHAELCLPDEGDFVVSPATDLPEGARDIRIGALRLIPYRLWDNRESGGMAVWLKRNR